MSLITKAADRLFIGKVAHGRKELTGRSHRTSNNPLMTRRIRELVHSLPSKFCRRLVNLAHAILAFM